MQEWLDQYIRHLEVERNLSSYTIRNYSSDILHFMNFLKMEEIHSLEDVDPKAVRNYLGQLLDSGVVRASISRKMSALRSFFCYMNQHGFIENEPLQKVSTPKKEKKLPSFLTFEEILSLLSAPDISTAVGLRDLAILEMLYASGLRVSEIASLNVNSLDLDSRQVRVWGKGSKERVVLIGEPAALVLRQYLNYSRQNLVGAEADTALFLNRYGNRIAERRIQYLLKKYAKKAGITTRVHPHMLRHTFATHMLDGGADLRVVQELLGHTSLSSTQVYTHVTRSQMRSRYLEAHPRSNEKTKAARNQEKISENDI